MIKERAHDSLMPCLRGFVPKHLGCFLTLSDRGMLEAQTMVMGEDY